MSVYWTPRTCDPPSCPACGCEEHTYDTHGGTLPRVQICAACAGFWPEAPEPVGYYDRPRPVGYALPAVLALLVLLVVCGGREVCRWLAAGVAWLWWR
jgi:hypothetical protein